MIYSLVISFKADPSEWWIWFPVPLLSESSVSPSLFFFLSFHQCWPWRASHWTQEIHFANLFFALQIMTGILTSICTLTFGGFVLSGTWASPISSWNLQYSDSGSSSEKSSSSPEKISFQLWRKTQTTMISVLIIYGVEPLKVFRLSLWINHITS